MDHEKEKDLLMRIKKDPQDFSFIYDQYYDPIFAYIYRRLGNYDQAQDIAAETFLKAYQKISKFEWRGVGISSWLYRIATNELNICFRKSKYKPTFVDDINLHAYLSYDEGIETEKASLQKAFEEKKEFMSVQQELVSMDIKYQEVIALRFFEEKSIREISVILNKNEGTIKSLLSRGLNKLKLVLEKKKY